MHFDFIYNFCLKHFSISEQLNEILSQMYTRLHIQYPSFLSDFNNTWLVLKDFPWILKYQFSRKSIQWEPSCSIRTDMTKLKVTFQNFGKVPKNQASTSQKTNSASIVDTKVDVSRIYRSYVLKIKQNTDRVKKCTFSECYSKWYKYLPFHFKRLNQWQRETYYSKDQLQNLSL